VIDYVFGDIDPEDGWDDADSMEAKIDVLERVVLALAMLAIVPAERRDDALRLVDKLERTRAAPPRLSGIRHALEAF
jgi:hypothetical protein